MENLEKIFTKLKNTNHTIHCLTNPISINDMANVILSVNQSPIMADNPKETGEITANSNSLLINLGNLQDYRMEAMEVSIAMANKKNIPVSLDLVGVSASRLRLDFSRYLLNNYKFDLIKGNYSEIFSLDENILSTAGVDSKDLETEKIIKHEENINKKYGSMVLASGKKDIVLGKNKIYLLSNGDKRLKKITGTGCILGGLAASVLSIERSLEAMVLAVSIENIAAEDIGKDLGLFSFKIEFFDNISLIDMKKIKEKLKYERF